MQSDSQPMTLAALIERLSAKLSVGETIVLEEIPEQFLQTPEVQNLLRLARVNDALDANRAALVPSKAMPEHIAQWRIVRLLGQGGMGDVWLGAREQADLAHQVAIKCVRTAHPRFVERLKLERQILAKLNHPNVASFIDAGIDDQGMPWMAMEYIDGSNICDWCEGNRLSLEARIQLLLKVCAAVAHAHRHLIVHRDIKPGNILVNAEGEPKLLDFGISKLLGAEAEQTTVHSLTPSYAAPEQLRGGVISTATDVYSLGLLLFRLIAGTLPHTRQDLTLAQVLEKLDQEETARPSEAARRIDLPYTGSQLGGDLDAIVFKALRLDPQLRYDGAAALAQDLQRYLAREPVSARAPTWSYRARRFARRHAVALGFSSLALFGILVGSALALQQASRAQHAAVQAIQQAALAAKEADNAKLSAKTAERVTTFALKALSEMNPHGRVTTTIKTGAELVQQQIDVAKTQLRDDPRALARILAKLAEIQAVVSSASQAEDTLRYTLTILDPTDPDGAVTQSQIRYTLAGSLLQQSRFEEAEKLLLQVLPDFANKPELARWEALGHANLALIARNTGRTDVALERLGKAYELAKIAYGAEHPNTIELIANRALLFLELERWSDAKAMFLKAISEYELHQGRDFPRLVLPLAQLASIQARFGEPALAIVGCERAMQIASASFSADDPQFARHRYSCAKTMLQLGDFARVEALIEASAPAEAKQPEIAGRNAMMLAELHLLQQKFAIAQTHFARAQSIYEEAKPPLKNDLPRLNSLAVMLDAALDLKRYPNLEPVLAACEKDPLLCAAQAVVWQRQGRAEQAFLAFEGARQRQQSSKMNLSLLGAYQRLLREMAVKDGQHDAAKRWQSLADSVLASDSK
jgi:eukaryotic-like serine/threonine-protein kinase